MLLIVKEIYEHDGVIKSRERHLNPDSIDEMVVHRFGAIIAETGGSKNYTKVTTNKRETFIIEGLPREILRDVLKVSKSLLKG